MPKSKITSQSDFLLIETVVDKYLSLCILPFLFVAYFRKGEQENSSRRAIFNRHNYRKVEYENVTSLDQDINLIKMKRALTR